MTLHIKVRKTDAQNLLNRLRKDGIIDRRYQVQRMDDYVLIPVEGTPVDNFDQIFIIEDIEPKESKTVTQPKKAGGAFDLIGDIAVTKIRNRDRASSLAKELVALHPNIKTVYLDKGIIGEYRLRDLELLEGDEVTVTRYRENGVFFELDVSRVYFSPRLATERFFVAKETREGEQVIDMFAGVGSFSLNIAKLKYVTITAIDNNPSAIEYMKKSMGLNKLKGKITPLLGEASAVMNSLPPADRIIMNLPHEAHRYLDIALKRLKTGGTLHYYEIMDMFGIEDRMEQFRLKGLEITKKREVHGYSSSQSMYSLTATKIWE